MSSLSVDNFGQFLNLKFLHIAPLTKSQNVRRFKAIEKKKTVFVFISKEPHKSHGQGREVIKFGLMGEHLNGCLGRDFFRLSPKYNNLKNSKQNTDFFLNSTRLKTECRCDAFKPRLVTIQKCSVLAWAASHYMLFLSVPRCSDKIIRQLRWQHVNKWPSHIQLFFQLVVPLRKNTFVFLLLNCEEKHKLIDLPGRFRLVGTRMCPSSQCEKPLLLTRSPQTHGCDQMSFDLHVMELWGLYNSRSQPRPHLKKSKLRINCCRDAATKCVQIWTFSSRWPRSISHVFSWGGESMVAFLASQQLISISLS